MHSMHYSLHIAQFTFISGDFSRRSSWDINLSDTCNMRYDILILYCANLREKNKLVGGHIKTKTVAVINMSLKFADRAKFEICR